MTPERQKALEAVAEAAREMYDAIDRETSNPAYHRLYPVWGRIGDAVAALDALPDPAPAGEVRKIVSMVTGRDADDVCLEYAICSDGTAWLLQWDKTTPIGWTPLPPIPTTTRLPLTEGGV
jgi:hypothetical protein